jgi:basic amino acid/polyamine antiporter, APA family
MSDVSPGALRRELRLLDAVGVGLGAVIGAGLFVVTGVAARVAGPAFLVGLVAAGVAASCNGLSAAQLAAAFPRSGGTYEYGQRLLGGPLGFAAGWLFLASKLAAGGTVALGFGAYLAALVPAVPPRAAGVAAAVVLTAANYFGIRKAGRLNLLIVAVTLVVLAAFVAAGVPAFRASNLRPFAPTGAPGILEAAGLLFFAYTGYARVATLGEEVHDPRRTIPRAIGLTLAIASLLYVAVGLVAVGAVGADRLGGAPAPLQEAASAFPVPGLPALVAVGATSAMLGVLLSQVFAISRMAFAMARGGDLPRPLAAVHPAHAVPHVAVLSAGAVLVLVSIAGTLEGIVAAASFTILVYYAITNLAALRLPRADVLYPRWIPVVGLLCCAVLAASLPLAAIRNGVLLLIAGFALRRIFRVTLRSG